MRKPWLWYGAPDATTSVQVWWAFWRQACRLRGSCVFDQVLSRLRREHIYASDLEPFDALGVPQNKSLRVAGLILLPRIKTLMQGHRLSANRRERYLLDRLPPRVRCMLVQGARLRGMH